MTLYFRAESLDENVENDICFDTTDMTLGVTQPKAIWEPKKVKQKSKVSR